MLQNMFFLYNLVLSSVILKTVRQAVVVEEAHCAFWIVWQASYLG